MCQGLRALQQSITTYAGGFDAEALTAAQAGEVVRLCAQIEASAASIKVLAAARSAEANSWQHDGYRSASEQLAAQAGMSPAAAKRALETGRRLADQPEVAAAALAGEVSLEQATAISDGVAADPAQAAALIDKAKHSSLPELNDEVAKVKAARRDAEQHHQDRHTKRSLRRWTDRDGALHAHLYGHPEDGARLWRMLDPIRRRLNIIRRQSGATSDSLDALDYDAIMTMAAIANGTDGELSLADLVELGLFPQHDTSTLTGRPAPPPPPPAGDPDLYTTADPAGRPAPAPPPRPAGDPGLYSTADPADPDLFSTVDAADPADPADPDHAAAAAAADRADRPTRPIPPTPPIPTTLPPLLPPTAPTAPTRPILSIVSIPLLPPTAPTGPILSTAPIPTTRPPLLPLLLGRSRVAVGRNWPEARSGSWSASISTPSFAAWPSTESCARSPATARCRSQSSRTSSPPRTPSSLGSSPRLRRW
jgi:hypothetical protein